MRFPRELLGPTVSPQNPWILEVSVGQVLHQTLVEEAEEEKEKLHLGLVGKALQRVVGVEEKHSLRRNLAPLQVGEEVAAAALLLSQIRGSLPLSLSGHAGHQFQEAVAAMTPMYPQS